MAQSGSVINIPVTHYVEPDFEPTHGHYKSTSVMKPLQNQRRMTLIQTPPYLVQVLIRALQFLPIF